MNFHLLLDQVSDQNIHYKKILTEAYKERVLLFNPQAPEIQLSEMDGDSLMIERFGLYSEDISGYWTPNLREYFEEIIESYKVGVSLYSEMIKYPKNKLDKPRYLAQKLLASLKALGFIQWSTPWATWIWVLDSLDTIAYDVATIQSRSLPRKDQDLTLLASKVTYEQRLQYVKDNYFELSPHLWVAKNDVGVIIYDPKAKPYGLKNGWSFEQVGEILSEWFRNMTDEPIRAEIRVDTED